MLLARKWGMLIMLFCFILAGCREQDVKPPPSPEPEADMIGTLHMKDDEQHTLLIYAGTDRVLDDVYAPRDVYAYRIQINGDTEIRNAEGTSLAFSDLGPGQRLKVWVNGTFNARKTRVGDQSDVRFPFYDARRIEIVEVKRSALMDQLRPDSEDAYGVFVFTKSTQDADIFQSLNLDDPAVSKFAVVDTGVETAVPYEKWLEIEEYPVIIVFDRRGEVFRTQDPHVLNAFFNKR